MRITPPYFVVSGPRHPTALSESGVSREGRGVHVYLLARKALIQNTRVRKQAASLVRAGYQVTVLAPTVGGFGSPGRLEGATVVRLPAPRLLGFRPGWRFISFNLSAYRYLRQRVRPGDIVHCNDLDTLPPGLLAARGRATVVYDVQDLYPDQGHISLWLGRLLRLIERSLIGRVGRTIAVNPAIADVMAERYGIQVNAVVLNCPPFDDLAPRPGTAFSLREQLGIAQDQRIVVYSGVLAPGRGLENTILALRELPGACLVFLGEGPLRDPLEQLASQTGLTQSVRFVNFVPHLEVPRFIRSADVGIVPYERSGLNHYLCSPSKLFHYIMAELPVVCSDFPFLRQVVLGSQIGSVFDPADPSSIARAIREVIQAPDGQAGRAQRLRELKRRYCWEEEERGFLAAYRSL